jgi:hypothetical protein
MYEKTFKQHTGSKYGSLKFRVCNNICASAAAIKTEVEFGDMPAEGSSLNIGDVCIIAKIRDIASKNTSKGH